MLIGYDETDVEMQIQFAAFRDGLRKLGWTEGGNIRIDTRWATLGDSELIRRCAKELVLRSTANTSTAAKRPRNAAPPTVCCGPRRSRSVVHR